MTTNKTNNVLVILNDENGSIYPIANILGLYEIATINKNSYFGIDEANINIRTFKFYYRVFDTFDVAIKFYQEIKENYTSLIFGMNIDATVFVEYCGHRAYIFNGKRFENINKTLKKVSKDFLPV